MARFGSVTHSMCLRSWLQREIMTLTPRQIRQPHVQGIPNIRLLTGCPAVKKLAASLVPQVFGALPIVKQSIVLGKTSTLLSSWATMPPNCSRNSRQLTTMRHSTQPFFAVLHILRSIQVPLEKVRLALDLAFPLSKLDPTAATVFGVVNSVTAVSLFQYSIARMETSTS